MLAAMSRDHRPATAAGDFARYGKKAVVDVPGVGVVCVCSAMTTGRSYSKQTPFESRIDLCYELSLTVDNKTSEVLQTY